MRMMMIKVMMKEMKMMMMIIIIIIVIKDHSKLSYLTMSIPDSLASHHITS
jgi:uncharacterized membrane protein YqjE